ncbi:MAG: glucosaminidase domain-containing protein, partial [Streptosporangiaceae bacterium]
MAALVTLSAGGAITGFSFAPKAAADFSSPTSLPLNLVALRQSVQSAQPDRAAPSHDAMLRAAIVHVADYYVRMAQTKTPAEMEAIIWQHDSLDGVDHGESCAAFASLTLELGAQVVGLQSWVTGGGSYPWPLHTWADVRVDENPASLGITSIQQDAEAHHRWHPLGDGYEPLPGDWVLFDGHVEVVTKDAGGVLDTVGGDSLPNFSVNAHEYQGPLSRAGVAGFVNNGSLPAADQVSGTQGQAPAGGQHAAAEPSGAGSGGGGAQPSGAGSGGSAREASLDRRRGGSDASAASGELAAIPGTRTAQAAPGLADPAIPGLVPAQRTGPADHEEAAAVRKAAQQGKRGRVAPGGAAIPGFATDGPPSHQGTLYRRHHPIPVPTPVSETQAQQAFISEVAPGAVAAQRRYGVPAAVTIAQAIDESGWGQSELASQDHNLFGIKGTGPAGSVPLPTQEYVNGQPVSTSASFRVYNNVAESIDDHGRLLARSGYYQQAMADRQHPDRFAAALTGVYATDPNYGASLISLMRRYDLYRYGPAGQAQQAHSPAVPAPGSATIPGVGAAPSAPPERTGSAAGPAASRQPTRKRKPQPTRPASPQPSRTVSPQPTGTASPQPTRTASPQPTGTASPQPTRTASPQPTVTGSPPPAGTASPMPTRTASPRSSATDRPQPAAGAQPAATDSPHRAPADSSGATPAARPPRSGSAPAATPSVSRAQADIPGVTTQSEAENAITSAVRFGPAAAFVPVAESESESPMTSAVRFGPEASFVPVARSAPARPASARSAPARPASARSAP